MNHYTVIDEKNWKRALHCRIFRDYMEPAFCVTMELDITEFLQKVRQHHYSFTLAMVYAVTKCANEIEEFRYRFLDDKVVLFDKIDTSFTYLGEGDELFKVVMADYKDTMEEYVTSAKKIAREQEAYFTGPMGTDVFQFSPMPWITYTHISHTNSGKKSSGTPMFDWGKFYEKECRTYMPFSIQVHHSFVDGVHIGQMTEKLQTYLKESNLE